MSKGSSFVQLVKSINTSVCVRPHPWEMNKTHNALTERFRFCAKCNFHSDFDYSFLLLWVQLNRLGFLSLSHYLDCVPFLFLFVCVCFVFVIFRLYSFHPFANTLSISPTTSVHSFSLKWILNQAMKWFKPLKLIHCSSLICYAFRM